MKLKQMREIMLLLGMSNSLDNISITSENMEIASKYIADNRKDLHKIFNIADRCDKLTYSISYLGYAFLRMVFKSWNGGHFTKQILKNSTMKTITYALKSKYYENPPYMFNLTLKEESLNEPIPMTGVNESLKIDYTNSLTYKIEQTKEDNRSTIIPENSIICFTTGYINDVILPTKTDLHRMSHIKRGINRRFNNIIEYYDLRPDLQYTQNMCFLCC